MSVKYIVREKRMLNELFFESVPNILKEEDLITKKRILKVF